MQELLGRNINAGDLVYASPLYGKFELEQINYGLVVSSNQCYFKNGVKKVNKCYLIANPCEQELQIMDFLKQQYSQYLLEQQQKIELQKKRTKELRACKLDRYLPGDCFKDSEYYMIIYLGLVKCETNFTSYNYGYNTDGKWLHGYMTLGIDELDKLQQNSSIIIDIETIKKLFSKYSITTQKTLSKRFTEVYKHYDICDECYKESILCTKYKPVYNTRPGQKEYLFDFKVNLKKGDFFND